jgi:uncharacterized protein YndB with AHSA1/START domain
MPGIEVRTTISAPPDVVWAAIEDIGSHVEWMADAEAIRFDTDQTSGVGTSFECDTKVGPFRLTDHMTITAWEAGSAMGVRHTGLVSGEGRFTLTSLGDGRTLFAWRERLGFPWWLAAPVLWLVWRRNLSRLRRYVES